MLAISTNEVENPSGVLPKLAGIVVISFGTSYAMIERLKFDRERIAVIPSLYRKRLASLHLLHHYRAEILPLVSISITRHLQEALSHSHDQRLVL